MCQNPLFFFILVKNLVFSIKVWPKINLVKENFGQKMFAQKDLVKRIFEEIKFSVRKNLWSNFVVKKTTRLKSCWSKNCWPKCFW